MFSKLAQYVGTKAVQKAQWRLLKATLLLTSVWFFVQADSEVAFYVWGTCVVVVLSYLLTVKKHPLASFVGLLFSVITIPLTIIWFGASNLTKVFGHGIRFSWHTWRNSRVMTSLGALVFGVFLFALGVTLTIRGWEGSHLWQVAKYLTWGVGGICVVQLICFCREPLAPFAGLAEKAERFVSSVFDLMKDHRVPLLGLIVHAATFDSVLRSLSVWLQKQEAHDAFKRFRTKFFIVFWFLLLIAGTFFFTNLFVLAGVKGANPGIRGYFDVLLTVITAITGNLFGVLPQTLWCRVLFTGLCIFGVVAIVLLVLVYSISIDDDISRISRAIEQSSRKSGDALLAGFEKVLWTEGIATNSPAAEIMPAQCRFKLPEQKDWLTHQQFADAVKRLVPPPKCKMKMVIPIRQNASLVKLQVGFPLPLDEPPKINASSMHQESSTIFSVEQVDSRYCEIECSVPSPESAEKPVCKVNLRYEEGVTLMPVGRS